MRINEIFLVLILITPSAFESWKGIVPLRSTRTEVERQLGSPVTPCEHTCKYKSLNESTTVVYSTAPCGPGEHNRWRVPVGTVVTVIVYPVVKPKLKDLKLNLANFTKSKDPELPGHWVYTNSREGISYEVSNAGRVLSIERFPASKDDSLSCDDKDIGARLAYAKSFGQSHHPTPRLTHRTAHATLPIHLLLIDPNKRDAQLQRAW